MSFHFFSVSHLVSVSTSHPRGDMVDGLPRAASFEKVEDFEENTWNSYSNQCFRGLGVLGRVV